jgi:hypothetical protein
MVLFGGSAQLPDVLVMGSRGKKRDGARKRSGKSALSLPRKNRVTTAEAMHPRIPAAFMANLDVDCPKADEGKLQRRVFGCEAQGSGDTIRLQAASALTWSDRGHAAYDLAGQSL